MSSAAAFQQLLAECHANLRAKNYVHALKQARLLLNQDTENIALHRLLALLYGLNNQHKEAYGHYLILVQFDPTYEPEHAMLVAEGFAAMGNADAAATICAAASTRFNRSDLLERAADYYQQAGNVAKLQEIKKRLATA